MLRGVKEKPVLSNEELEEAVLQSIKENKKAVVLLDGLLFIKNSTAFENMLNLMEHIKDKIATKEAIFIASVNTDVLAKEQREQLENEFVKIDGWRKGE